MKTWKFEVWQSKRDGLWYFHIVSRNGKTVFPSQGYTRKSNAMKSIRSLRVGVPSAVIEYL